jgi:hypothetical protein
MPKSSAMLSRFAEARSVAHFVLPVHLEGIVFLACVANSWFSCTRHIFLNCENLCRVIISIGQLSKTAVSFKCTSFYIHRLDVTRFMLTSHISSAQLLDVMSKESRNAEKLHGSPCWFFDQTTIVHMRGGTLFLNLLMLLFCLRYLSDIGCKSHSYVMKSMIIDQ